MIESKSRSDILLEERIAQIDDINFESDIGDEGRPVEFTFKKGEKEYRRFARIQ